MGGYISYVVWIISGILIGVTQGKNCSKSIESCLHCESTGEKCAKCRHLIVFGTRECAETCPMGYRQQRSPYDDYMGQICIETSFIASLGVTGETFTVLVGAFTGIFLCVGALLGGCIYARRRRIKALSAIDENSDSTLTVTPLHQQERGEFIRELSLLRHEAPIFLSMLNETRRQVREIYKSKTTNHRRETAAYAYRPVLRDLYLILVLLNKSEEKILSPPPDWRKLLSWGERVLKRYKRQNNIVTPIGELVNFLQVPESQRNFVNSRSSLFQPYSTLSTVSTNTLTSTVSRKQRNNNKSDGAEVHNANGSRRDSILDINDGFSDSNPVFKMPNMADEINTLNRFSFSEADFDNWDENHTILAEWSASRENLFEDDFIRLGFRPQDEITTEL